MNERNENQFALLLFDKKIGAPYGVWKIRMNAFDTFKCVCKCILVECMMNFPIRVYNLKW